MTDIAEPWARTDLIAPSIGIVLAVRDAWLSVSAWPTSVHVRMRDGLVSARSRSALGANCGVEGCLGAEGQSATVDQGVGGQAIVF